MSQRAVLPMSANCTFNVFELCSSADNCPVWCKKKKIQVQSTLHVLIQWLYLLNYFVRYNYTLPSAPKDCDHENKHNCHYGPCPPCKQVCNKLKPCGHRCPKICHSKVVVCSIPNFKPATPLDVVSF